MIARILLLVGLFAMLCAGYTEVAAAAETKTGDEIVIRGSETIDGDLYVFGRNAIIAGTINGDLIGTVETIRITGTINGSVNLVARKIDIAGTIAKAVRVTAAEVIVDGILVGDLLVAAGDVTITEDGAVGGDLLVGNGNLSIGGPVTGDLRGSAGDVSINSGIGGSVRLTADNLSVTRNGIIGGDLRYASNSEATISNAATIAGLTIRTSSFRPTGGPDLFSALTSQLMRLFAGLVTGLVLLSLLPRPVIATADTIRKQPLNAAMTGFLGILVWIVLTIGLVVLVVGAPIALIGAIFLICAAYLSQIFVGLALGRLILPDSWKAASRGYNILAMAIGMIFFSAIRAMPLPYLSVGIGAVVAIIGIGGVLLTFQSGPDKPAPTEAIA